MLLNNGLTVAKPDEHQATEPHAETISPPVADIAACTIISKNYISYARTLANSFLAHHPGCPFLVLLVDRIDGHFETQSETFHLTGIDALDIPDLSRFCFQYTILELNTAVKPYFLSHLLDTYGFKKLIYLDPDIIVTENLSHISRLLDQHSIILTPHLTAQIDDGYRPSELDILLAGSYNLGFIAIGATPTTRTFLKWWQERLYANCQIAFDKGMFVDQRWIDLVPGLFDGVHILREPEYNVAYWNLHSRSVEFSDGRLTVNGEPCRFFHFSGFDPNEISAISKHQNRLTIDRVGSLAGLFEYYRDLLWSNGYRDTRQWPYAFGCFSNGMTIPDVARVMYRALGQDCGRFGDPFSAEGPHTFFTWLQESVDGEREPGRAITRLWYEIYLGRPDLQRAYPDVLGRDREDFLMMVASAKVLGVNVAGYFESEKGVGEAARASVRALKAVPIPHVLNNVTDSGSWNRERSSSNYGDANPHPVNLLHVNADQVPMVASQLGDAYFRGRYNIGYWFWELSHFPEEWSSSFEYFDEVWVGSNFVLDAISRVSPIPVVRMPLALRERADKVGRGDRSHLGLSAESFVFVFMFDFHSFIARKNPLGLIEAFKMAFSDEDDVWLILKSAHSGTNAADFEAVKAAATGAKIKLVDTVLSEGETTALLSMCDCYVSLHRSEGFGLPIAEAMSLGKPVIVTAYSGNMDFTTPSNSLLVKYRLVELDLDYGPYKKGSFWADPNLDHAAELMRYAYENRDASNAVGRRAREDVLQLFHPRVVGRHMHDRLQRVVSLGNDSGKGRHERSSSRVTQVHSGDEVVMPSSEAIPAPWSDEVAADMTSLHADYDICEPPLPPHPRVVGRAAIGLTKRILRQLVTPILMRQVTYNAANTRVVTRLKEQAVVVGQQQTEFRMQLKQQAEALGRQQAQLGTHLEQQGEALGQQQAQLQQQREALGQQQAQLQQQREALDQQQAQLQKQGEALGQQQAQLWTQLKQQGEVLGQQQAQLRHDVLGRQEEALDRMRGRVSSVERRLRRMLSLVTGGQEEASAAPVETKRVIRQALDGDFDYFGLEERFRGSEELIKDRQRMYIDYFQGQEEVLDIGCGRGEFLELLRERGIKARGADIDTDMVLLCREKGLDVVKEDAFSCLENLPDESLGGIFAAQVIEHFPSDQIIRLVRRCYQKTRPGGVVVLETPNPQCLSVFARSFYMDFTHVWPCHPEAMRYLLESVGFEEIRLVFSSPVNSSLGIPPVADARVFGEETDRFNRTAAVLNELLLGPQDYAIIGWRKG